MLAPRRPLAPLLTLALTVVLLPGCGGSSAATATGTAAVRTTSTATTSATGTTTAGTPGTTTTAVPRPPAPPPPPNVLAAATGSGPTPFVPAVRWRGATAVWVARTPGGVTLLSFDQRLATLHLHSGSTDAGSVGWRFGPEVEPAERPHLLAAFNGGFRLSTGAGGFLSYGRTAVPLRPGAGSIVTYRDGTTDVGTWDAGVPAAGRPVASVRQNLSLLVDHGAASPTASCGTCWGATLGGVVAPARSALGVTADGRLIWAGGEHLTASDLAAVLVGARVVRAVELDINPEWVAAYVYTHHGRHGPPGPVPMVAGQAGIPGQYLVPWSRDFFTVVAR